VIRKSQHLLRMILSEKSATPAFAGAGFFGIMREPGKFCRADRASPSNHAHQRVARRATSRNMAFRGFPRQCVKPRVLPR